MICAELLTDWCVLVNSSPRRFDSLKRPYESSLVIISGLVDTDNSSTSGRTSLHRCVGRDPTVARHWPPLCSPSSRVPGQASYPGNLRGFVDRVRGEWKVDGWARNIDHPLLSVLLEVFLEGKVIGTVLACDFRDDLFKAIGNENTSFVFESPVKIRPESLGSLRVRRDTDGALLANSKSLLSPAPTARASESSQPTARPAALADGERVRLSFVR